MTVQNRSQTPSAPYTSAASYKSLGIDARPARKRTILKPTACQMPMTHKAPRTVSSF